MFQPPVSVISLYYGRWEILKPDGIIITVLFIFFLIFVFIDDDFYLKIETMIHIIDMSGYKLHMHLKGDSRALILNFGMPAIYNMSISKFIEKNISLYWARFIGLYTCEVLCTPCT